MIAVIIFCAGLCALTCLWVFKPLRIPRAFYGVSFLCAVLSLGIYMLLGSPELPGHPAPMGDQARYEMRKESEIMALLDANPNDEDAIVRLAALRVLQGRIGPETTSLLDRAKTLKPDDRRITVIRSMILYPTPGK